MREGGGGQERKRKEDIYIGSSQATIWYTAVHWDCDLS